MVNFFNAAIGKICRKYVRIEMLNRLLPIMTRVIWMLKTETIVKTRTLEQAALFAVSAVGGFLLAGASISGTASFANISLAGAIPLPWSAAVLAGSLLKYVIAGSVPRNVVQIASMLICIIYKIFVDMKGNAKYCGICTGTAVFVSGAAVSAILGELLYKLIFYAFYGAFAGLTAWCTSLVCSRFKNQMVLDLSAPISCAYAVVYTIAEASLCSVKVPYINIGVIIGAAVTLTAAYHYRYIGGVLCGALTTCGAFLADRNCGMIVVLLPAAGLLTGYLHKQKPGTAAGFFVGISFVFMIFGGVSKDSPYQMLDMIAGSLLFMMISPYFSDKWIITSKGTEALPEIISTRMGFMAGSIESVRRESGKISELLSVNTSDKAHEIKGGETCSHCHRRLACWYNNKTLTKRAFEKLENLYEFSKENFPYELDDCLHKEELMKEFEKKSTEKITARIMKLRLSDSQRLLAEQIRITEDIICSAGKRTDFRYSAPVSRIINRKLEKYGFTVKSVIACYNSRNRLIAEIYFDASREPESCIRICDLIADELRLNLNCAAPVRTGNEVRIRIFERPQYSMEVYEASRCAEQSGETGDSTSVFTDGTGISYVILSDGMGTGRDAAIESRMVVSMFKKLIAGGVNYLSAIRLINSIMLTKSENEAFATLDAVRIDLDSCGMTVIKSGASATLIRRRGQVMKVASPTFPIGIVETAEAFAQNFELEENDIIIMFSDGISENEYQFIKELLLGNNDLKFIVDEICEKADVFNPNFRPDDVTVLGMRVYRS